MNAVKECLMLRCLKLLLWNYTIHILYYRLERGLCRWQNNRTVTISDDSEAVYQLQFLNKLSFL